MTDPRILEIVDSTYAAFSRGDVEAVLELMHADVEWHPPPTSVDPQTLHGREAVREYHLYVFRDDQVVRFEAYVDRDQAMAAFRPG
jgi:ketosteroid isomerase-like protein